jgi:hypothetical protein
VQHTSAGGVPNSRKSQQTAHTIKIGATSGASLGSNFSKAAGSNMPKTTGNDNFLRSLMQEQQFQLMQNKSGDGGPTSNTQILTTHGSG